MFQLVKTYKVPPTTASKIYASLMVSQRDFSNLSYNLKGRYEGSIDPISSAVLCIFFVADCQDLTKNVVTDEYSEKLYFIVFNKIIERVNSDDRVIKTEESPAVEEAWNGINPTTPHAGKWKTWLIDNPNDFTAPPPPLYNSPEDLDQLAQVKSSVDSVTTTQKQAITYWAGGAGTETPAGIWLKIGNDLIKKNDLPLSKALEVRASVAMTIADGFITCWNNKFIYWTKRPNMRDPSIETVIKTPNFPSYTSGHSTISAAAATILGYYFEGEKDILMKMSEEAKNSRLWAGIHFPIDNEAGYQTGQRLAASILLTKLGRL